MSYSQKCMMAGLLSITGTGILIVCATQAIASIPFCSHSIGSKGVHAWVSFAILIMGLIALVYGINKTKSSVVSSISSEHKGWYFIFIGFCVSLMAFASFISFLFDNKDPNIWMTWIESLSFFGWIALWFLIDHGQEESNYEPEKSTENIHR